MIPLNHFRGKPLEVDFDRVARAHRVAEAPGIVARDREFVALKDWSVTIG
jgi:hypothetical protein